MSITKSNRGGYFSFRPFISDLFSDSRIPLTNFLDGESYPAVNIIENDKSYEIELAAPGFKKEDFKVKIEDDILTISAEQQEEKEEKKKNYTRQEYYYNSFTRSFTLPENAKEEGMHARYEDGMLKLMLAKKTVVVSKAKEIEVA